MRSRSLEEEHWQAAIEKFDDIGHKLLLIIVSAVAKQNFMLTLKLDHAQGPTLNRDHPCS